jgi:hypothetical protein
VALSLKVILAIAFVGVQVLSVGLVTGWNIRTATQAILPQIEGNMAAVSAETSGYLGSFFNEPERDVKLIADLFETDIIDDLNEGKVENLFYKILGQSPHYTGMLLGKPDGSFMHVKREKFSTKGKFHTKKVTQNGSDRQTQLSWHDENYKVSKTTNDPADTFDPRVRPWYKQAVASNSVIWTAPYIFFTSKKPGVTAAVAIRGKNGKILGVVGIDVTVSDISSRFKAIAREKDAEIFLLDRQSHVIAHSAKIFVTNNSQDPNSKPTFASLDSLYPDLGPLARKAVLPLHDGTAAEGEKVSVSKVGGEKTVSLSDVSNINAPWVLGVVLSRSKFTAGIEAVAMSGIVVALIVTIIGIFLGLQIANSVGRPLAILQDNAKLVSNGVYVGFSAVRSRYKEIQETSIAFMGIVIKLKELADKTGETLEKDKK